MSTPFILLCGYDVVKLFLKIVNGVLFGDLFYRFSDLIACFFDKICFHYHLIMWQRQGSLQPIHKLKFEIVI